MQGSEPSEPDHNIDWFIFISTAIIVIGVCVPLILFPEAGARSASTAFDFVTAKFGVFYIGAGIAALTFLFWLALGPFMGIFVSKISRGRTIREMIFGMLGYGSVGCVFFIAVLGNYALHVQLSDLAPVVDILNGRGAPAAIIEVLASLSSGRWLLPFFAAICLIFMATTYDSASYTLASCATRRLPTDRHPARWNRVFWALGLGLVPITLLILGGLRSLQTAAVVVSLPLILVGTLMSVSLVKGLRKAEAAALPPSPDGKAR